MAMEGPYLDKMRSRKSMCGEEVVGAEFEVGR
jgi:hypothetical protein